MSEQVKPVLQPPPGYRAPPGTFTKPVPVRRPILPYHTPKKKRSCTCRTCCCATCLVLIILILLVGVAGCVFYLMFQPKVPVVRLQSVRFNRFNVTGKDVPVLASEAVVKILIRNRNGGLSMNFGMTDVGLRGGDVDLGKGSIPAFSQPKLNTTVLKLTTKVNEILVEGGKKVRDEYKSKKLMMWTEVNTKIGVGGKGWNTYKLPIKVVCDGVTLKDIENPSSLPNCKITIFKFIKIKT